MKRIVGLILVFCLVFSVIAEAIAEPKWEITQQTKVTVKEKKGKATSITISVKAKGKGIKYQWVFVDPENPERTSTGKKVAKAIKELKGLVVKGATKNKLVLTKIPDALNGWSIYCHLYSNAYKMDTDPVVIVLPGHEAPEQLQETASEKAEREDKDTKTDEKTSKEESKDSKETKNLKETKDSKEAKPSEEKAGEGEEEPTGFTVSANGKYLFETDSSGKAKEKEAASSLTFIDKINVVVKSEDPIKSWTVNGIRFEPEEEINSFSLQKLTADTAISLKRAAKTAASAKVDEGNMVTVTCEGCTFTYLKGGLKKVSEGKVPSGAVIYVMADSYDAAANGYVINGGEAQNLGDSSVQITVTEDTKVFVQQPDPPEKTKKK